MNPPIVIANGLLRRQVRLRVLPRLQHVLGEGVNCIFTAAPGDATRQARQALRSGADWLIAAGGDGTINEVVNGYFEAGRNTRPECPLSLLPLGSGNDWVRTLGVPLDVAQAVQSLRHARRRLVDVGLADFVNARGGREQRIFVNFAEAGMGASLVEHLGDGHARRRRAAYLLSAVTTSFRYKPRAAMLRFDGAMAAPSGPLLSLIVANGRFFGAGMECAPMARPDDGILDVITIGNFGWFELVLKMRKLVRGTHLSEAKVTHRAACSLEISAPDGIPLQLDGDRVGTLPATFTILPRALQLRC